MCCELTKHQLLCSVVIGQESSRLMGSVVDSMETSEKYDIKHIFSAIKVKQVNVLFVTVK